MWNQSKKAEDGGHLSQVIPDQVLYEFDEPLVFIAKLGLSDYLFTKIDQVDEKTILLASSLRPDVRSALVAGDLSVRGAVETGECYVVEAFAGGRVSKFWRYDLSEIPEEHLPVRGVGIDPEKQWVADTMAQVDAFS